MSECSCPYNQTQKDNIASLQFVSSPSELLPPAEVPQPPFWGVKHGRVDVSKVDSLLCQTYIIEHWGYKNRGLPHDEYLELLASGPNKTYATIVKDIVTNNLVDINYKYGYFYAQSSGNFLLLNRTPDLMHSGDLARGGCCPLLFRRSLKAPFYNIPDCFHHITIADCPLGAVVDVAPLGMFTLGNAVEETLTALLDSGDYKGYYLYHIVYSNLAKGVQGYISDRIRSDLGLEEGVGASHSFMESQYTRVDDLPAVASLLEFDFIEKCTPSNRSKSLRGKKVRRGERHDLGSQLLREARSSCSNYSQGFIFIHHPSSSML